MVSIKVKVIWSSDKRSYQIRLKKHINDVLDTMHKDMQSLNKHEKWCNSQITK